VVRTCALILLTGALGAVEVVVEWPELMAPNRAVDLSIRIVDAPAALSAIELPNADGVQSQLLNSVSASSSVGSDGRRTSVEERAFRMVASVEGELVLPPITVRFRDGTKAESPPATIRVGPGDASLVGEVVAVARFVPDRIVPGEQTELVYTIYLRRGDVSELGIAPPADAILLGEMTQRARTTIDADNKQWQGTTFTWPLTFAEPGERRVVGQQKYEVAKGYDLFNRPIQVQRKAVAIKPATLVVESLPSAGRPDDFHGLIGPVTAAATLERERITVGEGTAFTFAVSGRQVDLLPRPTLTLPAGVTAYPRDVAAEPGRRAFTWDLVPATAGDVALPALSVAYFDPASRGYRRAASEPLTLQVVPGRDQPLTVVGRLAPRPEPTATARATGPTLPPPLRGAAPPAAPPWLAAIGFIVGALVGGGAAVVGWMRARGPRTPPPGASLAKAVEAGDLDRAAEALHLLTPRLRDDASRALAARLAEAVDTARFGGASLPGEALRWARQLRDRS